MSRPLQFALIGHPLGHSVSPAIHAAAYRALGVPHRYALADCPDEPAVREQLRRLRAGEIAGANVTVPWKRLAFELADDADASARDTGVANVLSLDAGRVRASNTDARALAEEIALDCPGPRAAVVIGAGGAAQAAVVACRSLGIDAPVVTSRGFVGAPESWPRAEAFVALGAVPMAWPAVEGAARLDGSAALGAALLRADVLVQATSAGMRGAGPGAAVSDWVPWARLQPGALAIDVVYNPPETPFLAAASAAGLATRGGLGMLVRQAALAIRSWLGDMPDLAPLRRAAQEALGAAGPS